MKPLVSIVIANNNGRFLDEAIQNVFAQDMGEKVELIVCDGGLTDNSADIMALVGQGRNRFLR